MGKFFTKLKNLEGSVDTNSSEALKNCLQTPSPSVNWAFATPGHGIPYGTSVVIYGPPKGGKSIFSNALMGSLHRNDTDALAIKFNTELRGKFQDSGDNLKLWGIDPDRLVVYDVNQPEMIFDRIEHDIAAACQEGEKIKLIVIDSLSNIMGRRMLNADSVSQQQIGDQAATIKEGLMRILPIIRKYNIILVATAHVRAELDQREQMRGKTVKMQAAWATKHTFEFFCYTEPNQSKDGKVTLAGEDMTDTAVLDFMDKAQRTGHKIRFKVEQSSFGNDGRTAEFTLDYNQGIINQYEEIFTMAVNYGIIERPNNVTYKIGETSYRGLVACLTAIRDDFGLQKKLLDAVLAKDDKTGQLKKPLEKV
jgi:archaellum biogenesis ATPase FlaH